MNKIYVLLLVCGFFQPFTINAITHSVQVGGMVHFDPPSFNANIGDTVTWSWVNGTGSHTVTSVNIPLGAAAFNQALHSGVPSFYYVITKGGQYNYQCNLHPTNTAQFSVSGVGLADQKPVEHFNVHCDGHHVLVQFEILKTLSAELLLSDLTGRTIKAISLNGLLPGKHEERIEVDFLPRGIYFALLRSEGILNSRQFVLE